MWLFMEGLKKSVSKQGLLAQIKQGFGCENQKAPTQSFVLSGTPPYDSEVVGNPQACLNVSEAALKYCLAAAL